ncbi:MAG: hypothetical protein ACRD5M_13020 [Candidatus Acidiferrales bacterium]
MTTLIIYFAIAAGLLLLLLLASLRRTTPAEGTAQALLGAKQALRTLQLGLLPTELVGAFFARNDFDFVVATAPESIQRLFLAERKRIVLAWLSQVRLQIMHLQHFHFEHSRHFVRLSLAKEIVLAAEFAALRMRCRMLSLLVYFRGPYGAPYRFEKAAASAAHLCAISERSLAFLNLAESPALVGNSAGSGGPS